MQARPVVAKLMALPGSVTRFPPEASGYIHIGHAKAAFLNRLIGERLLLRFDDTNPAKENPEFEKAIIEDLAALGIKYEKMSFTSDHFEMLLRRATEMIREGKAYCDDTQKEVMRQQRFDGVASKGRSNTVEKNLSMWEEMQKGSPEGERICLRSRMEVDHPNKCLRDPVLYRCVSKDHPRTGGRYSVYPTYDFACPLVDAEEGVTIALRTSEYNDRNEQYARIAEDAKVRKVEVKDIARLNMEYTVMSKRKLAEFVAEGRVRGWDDPRMPTVRGMLRRGITPKALEEFVKHQGMSTNTNVMEWSTLYNFNRGPMEAEAKRYMAVDERRVPVTLDLDTPIEQKVPLHPKEASLGEKVSVLGSRIFLEGPDVALLKAGEEVTLLGFGNCIIETIGEGGCTGKLNLQGDFKKTKQKLSWVSDLDSNVPIVMHEFNNLMKERSIDKDTVTMPDLLNEKTEHIINGTAEAAVRDVIEGQVIQFQRRGFYKLDCIVEGYYHFFRIPDGSDKINHLSAFARDGVKTTSLAEKKKAAEGRKGGKAVALPVGSLLDLRMGLVTEVSRHPDADTLYVEKIDLGEPTGPRQIVSGLVKFVKQEDFQGKFVLVWCNLKPSKLRGVESSGMVMAATKDSEVQLVVAPEGTKPGDVVAVGDFDRCPGALSKKQVETARGSFKTDSDGGVYFEDGHMLKTDKGQITSLLCEATVG